MEPQISHAKSGPAGQRTSTRCSALLGAAYTLIVQKRKSFLSRAAAFPLFLVLLPVIAVYGVFARQPAVEQKDPTAEYIYPLF
ncbi:MAG: hypothetical protein U0136_15110 [Bdellovibrionota bacterium]